MTSTAMRTSILALMVAIAAIALSDSPVRAQPASALGQPLPRPNLAVGTLTVRVVEGDRQKVVSEADVRLQIDGAADARVARTDASGLATFTGLAAGTMVKAITAESTGSDTASIEFAMPADSGVAVMLSTVPWRGDPGGGGSMDGGRPSPRTMAGQARPEKNDPAGRVTVRLSYDDLDSTEGLVGHPVVMVAYSADDRVAAKLLRADAEGRAVFDGLDTTGATAYYALSLLSRAGADDRTMSTPIVPIPEVGLRLFLSGEKLASGLPPVDDLSKMAPQGALPPGQVLVAFGGAPRDSSKIELFDIAAGKVVATTSMRAARAVPGSIKAEISDVVADAKVAAGTVHARTEFSAGGRSVPLDGIAVTVRTVRPDGATAPVAGAYEQTVFTPASGEIDLAGAPSGVPLEALFMVEGERFASKPFTLEATRGVTVAVTASWQVLGSFEALFEGVASNPDGAYLVQTEMHEQLYRSPPFQASATRGVVVPVYVLPKIAVTFQLDATVDDEYFAVRGQVSVQNFAWAPYAGPSGGVKIAAPVGASGLVVAEEDKTWVSADASEFRLLRPVPPFGGQFRAGFSVPIDDGTVSWDMPLPFGSYQSSLAILQTPGMHVTGLPPDVTAKPVPQPNGTSWYAIQGITITPGKRMVFGITGLPQRPAWQRWARYGAGFAALLLIIAGCVFAASRPRSAPVTTTANPAGSPAARKKRKKLIDELLEQVATIDRAAGDGNPADAGPRDALIAELEALYREDEAAAEPRV